MVMTRPDQLSLSCRLVVFSTLVGQMIVPEEGEQLTSYARDGFFSRQIGDVNEGVVERSIDMRDAEHELSFCDLRTERDRVLFFGRLDFFGGL
jgi:hypothetical protein